MYATDFGQFNAGAFFLLQLSHFIFALFGHDKKGNRIWPWFFFIYFMRGWICYALLCFQYDDQSYLCQKHQLNTNKITTEGKKFFFAKQKKNSILNKFYSATGYFWSVHFGFFTKILQKVASIYFRLAFMCALHVT